MFLLDLASARVKARSNSTASDRWMDEAMAKLTDRVETN